MKRLLYLLLLIPFAVKAQIPIEIPVPVKVVNAYSLDWKRGPWATTTAAKSAIPQSIRVGGLTVWIAACSCEYVWLDGDLSDGGLQLKTAFVASATSSTAGIGKLYTSTGSNTDGSMTQNAITTGLNGKWNVTGTTNTTGNILVTGSTNILLEQSVTTGYSSKLNIGDAADRNGSAIGVNLSFVSGGGSPVNNKIYLDQSGILLKNVSGSAQNITLDATGSTNPIIGLLGKVILSSSITNDNTKTNVIVMDGSTKQLYYSTNVVVNPMTQQNDVIVGGASGVPTRLPKGSDNTFMSVQGGIVDYYSLLNGNGTTVGTRTFDWGGSLNNDVNIDDNTSGTHYVNIGATTGVAGFNLTTINPAATTSSENGKVNLVSDSRFGIDVYDGTSTKRGNLSFDSQGGLTVGADGGFYATGTFSSGAYLSLAGNDIVMGSPGISKLSLTFSNSSQTATFANGPVQFAAGGSTKPSVIFPQTFPSPSSPSDGWMWFDGNQLLFRRASNSTTYDLLAKVTSINVSGGTTGLTFSGGPVTTGGTITMAGTLAIANGGTGTTTPGLVAGTNVTITGTWPNQTINSSGSFSDPLTTNGDIIARVSGVTTRLAKGSNNTFLGVNGSGVLGYYAAGSGITNGAANGEFMKSDGTNAVSSGVTSSASGNMTMGLTTDGAGARILNVDGSSSNVSLYLQAKGSGIVNAITSQAFTITDQSSTYQITFSPGGASADPKIQGGRGQTRALTIIPMTGDASVNTGSDLKLYGSDAYSVGNNNGGSVHLKGGAANGSGSTGKVIFDNLAGQGSGVLTIDNSGNSGFSNAYNLDLNNASIAGSTITLDLNGQYQRMFVGSGTFATGKTMAVANASNARVFDFHFEVTAAPAATLTLPTGWLMNDANFSSHVWTPPTTGKYEMTATYDGNYWKVKIGGPFL